MVPLVLTAAAVLVIIGWVAYRRRLKGMTRPLDEGDIRQIENAGWVERDEPLDLDEAREEEERFWDQSWDEPEPW